MSIDTKSRLIGIAMDDSESKITREDTILEKKYKIISKYVLICVAAIIIIYKVVGNAPAIVTTIFDVLARVMNVLSPVFIAFVIAYLLNPMVDFFERFYAKRKWINKKTRMLAVLSTFFAVITVLVALISILVSSITKQIQIVNWNSFIEMLNGLINNVNQLYYSVINQLEGTFAYSGETIDIIENVTGVFFSILQNFLNYILLSVSEFAGGFSRALFSIIVSIYFMIDKKMVISLLKRITNVALPKKANCKLSELLSDLNTAFSGYLKGQLADVAFMMVSISIVLLFTGCKFAVVIGLFAGIGNLIPYVGPFIAYAFTILVCLVNEDYTVLLISLIALIIIQFIDANIVGPKLLSKSIEIHPVLVIIFLIIGSAIGGLSGMFLAVPTGGFFKIIFMKWLERKEQDGIKEINKETPKVKPKEKNLVNQAKTR